MTESQSFAVVYGVASVFWYWVGERPRQSFPSWALKVIALWLNFYVGFVSMPETLRRQIPETLAYGLPAFVVLLIFYRAAPLKQDDNRRSGPFWQWLLWAAGFAAFWGWFGPSSVK